MEDSEGVEQFSWTWTVFGEGYCGEVGESHLWLVD